MSAKFNPSTYYYGGYCNLRRPGGSFLTKTIAIGQIPCVAHQYELEVRKILPKYIHRIYSKEAELLTAWLLGETSWNTELNEIMFFRTTQDTKYLKDRITKCVIHIIRGKSINYETIHFSLVLLRYDRFCQYIKRTRPAEACPEGAH